MHQPTEMHSRAASAIGRWAAACLLALAALLWVTAPVLAQDHGSGHEPAAEKTAEDGHGAGHAEAHGMSTAMAWKAFLVQFIGFGLLVLLFGKLVWPMVGADLTKKRTDLEHTYQHLEQSRVDAERQLKEFEARLANLRQEEKTRTDAAEAEGRRIRDEMVREAEAQAVAILDKAKREIELARDVAVLEVRQSLLTQALDAAAQRLQKEVNVKTHHQLVGSLVQDMGKAADLVRKGGEA